MARLVHDFIADVARQHSKRLFGLATLPLLDMDASLKEMDRCVSKLGFKGVLPYSNLAGQFPDEPQFHPLFEHAQHMDIPIAFHPAYPMTYYATKGYRMGRGPGADVRHHDCDGVHYSFRAADKYPRLKIALRYAYSSDHPWVGPKLLVSLVQGLNLPASQQDQRQRQDAVQALASGCCRKCWKGYHRVSCLDLSLVLQRSLGAKHGDCPQ